MNIGDVQITRYERIVWLDICAGKTNQSIAYRPNLSVRKVATLRASLCAKLKIDPRDVQALVRAAAACDILKELPPLNVVPPPKEPGSGIRVPSRRPPTP